MNNVVLFCNFQARGFGMRVVGGKTGTDGRLFAYIVWTVPGGEAEKGGLRQGDKILEWCNVSLVDRSFEEVCSIMDRTGDVVELLVEHASDFRMCDDLFEDNSMQTQNPVPVPVPTTTRKNTEMVNLVAGMIDFDCLTVLLSANRAFKI